MRQFIQMDVSLFENHIFVMIVHQAINCCSVVLNIAIGSLRYNIALDPFYLVLELIRLLENSIILLDIGYRVAVYFLVHLFAIS